MTFVKGYQMKISVRWTLAILLGSFLSPLCSRAASVTLTPVPGVGRLHKINDGKQAVGYTLGGDQPEGFIYENGNRTFISIKNGTGVQVYGIENNGRAVGKYYEYEPVTKGPVKTHGFLYFHGDVTTIDVPGSAVTVCRGINTQQRIVGHYKRSPNSGDNGADHGFFFDKQNYTTIDFPGALSTYAVGINNPGDIVGNYSTPDSNGNGDHHSHGFLYDKNGNLTTIDVNIPGVTVIDTFCNDINNLGVIVGAYTDADGNTHGFVRINGVFLSVDAPDTPPGVGTIVQAISNNGDLTVSGSTAFLGTITQ